MQIINMDRMIRKLVNWRNKLVIWNWVILMLELIWRRLVRYLIKFVINVLKSMTVWMKKISFKIKI